MKTEPDRLKPNGTLIYGGLQNISDDDKATIILTLGQILDAYNGCIHTLRKEIGKMKPRTFKAETERRALSNECYRLERFTVTLKDAITIATNPSHP